MASAFSMNGLIRHFKCIFFSHKYDLQKVQKITIQNNVVQSIELHGNKDGTGNSRQNSQGTGLPKLAGAAALMTVQLTAITAICFTVTIFLIMTFFFYCMQHFLIPSDALEGTLRH